MTGDANSPVIACPHSNALARPHRLNVLRRVEEARGHHVVRDAEAGWPMDVEAGVGGKGGEVGVAVGVEAALARADGQDLVADLRQAGRQRVGQRRMEKAGGTQKPAMMPCKLLCPVPRACTSRQARPSRPVQA